jgi:hypothetical protein
MIVIVQIALLAKHISVSLERFGEDTSAIPYGKRSFWNLVIIGQRQFATQAERKRAVRRSPCGTYPRALGELQDQSQTDPKQSNFSPKIFVKFRKISLVIFGRFR